MIIWLNGGFGAGKSTLARELRRRLPEAVVFDPEDVGLMLWKWLEPGDDFQDLPSWRELVVATAVSLRAHHADTLIVPMALIRDDYRTEILGALASAGEVLLHVFLDAEPGVLRERLKARANADTRVSKPALDWTPKRVEAAGIAAGRQPDHTLILRSDRLSPAALAGEVLAVLGSRHAS